MELKVLSPQHFSLSYNSSFSNELIDRLNLLDEIEALINQDYKIIVVEGDEGVGKTSILGQFAKRHSTDCFTYFINTSCKATAKPSYLIEDIGKQLFFYLNSEEFDEFPIIDETTFNNLVIDLTKEPIKKSKKIFFVIDGIDQIEKSELELIKPLLSTLPWTLNNFYFIVSGTLDVIENVLGSRGLKKSKPFRVVKFSYDETLRFFNWPDSPTARDLHATWSGHPDRLSQIKRILNSSGMSAEEFLKKDLTEKDELLENEWRQFGLDKLNFNEPIIKAASILAFDDNLIDFQTIVKVINSDDLTIDIFSRYSFFKITENNISYVSPAFKRFALKKLNRYEQSTFTLLIKYYKEQNELTVVRNLPVLLDKNQDWNGILNLLTVNNITLLVQNSSSFSEIKRELNFGYKASKELKSDYLNVFKFSLFRSLVNGLQKNDVMESRLEACVALKKNIRHSHIDF